MKKSKFETFSSISSSRHSFLFFFGFDKWLIFRWEFYIKAARSRTLTHHIHSYFFEYFFFVVLELQASHAAAERMHAIEMERDENRKYNLLFFCSAIMAIIIFSLLLYIFEIKEYTNSLAAVGVHHRSAETGNKWKYVDAANEM